MIELEKQFYDFAKEIDNCIKCKNQIKNISRLIINNPKASIKIQAVVFYHFRDHRKSNKDSILPMESNMSEQKFYMQEGSEDEQ